MPKITAKDTIVENHGLECFQKVVVAKIGKSSQEIIRGLEYILIISNLKNSRWELGNFVPVKRVELLRGIDNFSLPMSDEFPNFP